MGKYIKILLAIVALCAFSSFGFNQQCNSQSLEPQNAVSIEELQQGSDYWNNWSNITALKSKVRELTLVAINRHHYIANEYDCNDMALDLWNMLNKGGTTWEPITSIIVVGDLDAEKESFSDCNHAWLAILNKPPNDESEVTIYALEPTNGEIYTNNGNPEGPNAKYFEGFFYSKPSDLRTDLGDRW